MDGLTCVRPRHDADVTPPTLERMLDQQHANDTVGLYYRVSINTRSRIWTETVFRETRFLLPFQLMMRMCLDLVKDMFYDRLNRFN